jgi:hypothetical protein
MLEYFWLVAFNTNSIENLLCDTFFQVAISKLRTCNALASRAELHADPRSKVRMFA